MSRVGKKPIKIPEGVKVDIVDGVVKVTGSKGELSYKLRPEISIQQEGDELALSVQGKGKSNSAYWGLTRALIANMIVGVTEGYEKRLQLEGVGYRASSDPQGVHFTLGYSHPVIFKKPEGVEIVVEDNKNVVVRGIDKQLVGQTAAKIRSLRKPEPYKGKGIRYKGEEIRTKPGKAGKI
jgi:large subunit ribosomal protein L6